MYDSLDITNILSRTEECPKELGDKICNAVKKGKTNFSTEKINNYQTIEYLLGISSLTEKECLIDKLQDVCSTCSYGTSTSTTIPSDGDTCVDEAIISEDGDCLITEAENNIIQE